MQQKNTLSHRFQRKMQEIENQSDKDTYTQIEEGLTDFHTDESAPESDSKKEDIKNYLA